MKKSFILILFVVMCAAMLVSCGSATLPETTCAELGVYQLNDIFVDADGNEILNNGVPVYHLSEDGHIATYDEKGKEVIAVAAQNLASFTCVEEAAIDAKYTDVKIPVVVLNDGEETNEIYQPAQVEIPITVPNKGRNRTVVVETADVNAMYFNDGESSVTFDGSEPVVVKATVVYPGSAKLIVKNVLGEIILTTDVNIKSKTVTDKAEIEKVKTQVANCKHSYKSTVVEPTEQAEGYTLHSCEKCGHKYRDTVTPKLPCQHDYSERVVRATCKEHGYTLCTCKKCGETEKKDLTELEAHNFKDEIIAPTCAKEGCTRHTCTECGTVVEDTTVAKKAHSFKTETVASTCSVQGYTKKVCNVCGYNDTDNYQALLPHTYGAEQRVEPTYGYDGYTYRTCSVCGKQDRTGTLPALACTNHNYVVENKWDASCVYEGMVVYMCSVCGAEKTETLPKTAHNYVEEVIAPTCHDDGCTTHRCTVCFDFYTDTYIPREHSWDAGRQEYMVVDTVCVTRCNECNADCGGFAAEHSEEHARNGGYGGWHSSYEPVYGYVTIYTCTRCGCEYCPEKMQQ